MLYTQCTIPIVIIQIGVNSGKLFNVSFWIYRYGKPFKHNSYIRPFWENGNNSNQNVFEEHVEYSLIIWMAARIFKCSRAYVCSSVICVTLLQAWL